MRAANGIFIGIMISMLLLGCSFQPEPVVVRTIEKAKTALQPEITIYVSGQVLKPGTYRLAKGSRLSDAIAAAGGLTQQADVRTVNLEEVLDSTAQLHVPAVGEAQAKQTADGRAGYSPVPRTEQVVAESSPPPPPARQTPVYRPSGSLSELERQMIEMVNGERSSRGLKTLAVDYGLVKTARLKSQDMIDNSYFDHVSPKWGTMSELFSSQGVTYRLAGENLAMTGSLEQAHRGLMNSPGHRMNLLNPPYTRIGIGIIQDSQRGLVITQHFAN